MSYAEHLIDILLGEAQHWPKPPRGFTTKPKATVTKSDFLSGSDVAALAPKQGIIVNGKKGRVIDVTTKGNEVVLTYVRGAKSFSKELSLVFNKTDKKTPIQYFTKSYDESVERFVEESAPFLEEPTKGMKNAYNRKVEARTACPECSLAIPVYPGRYPNNCPDCGTKIL